MNELHDATCEGLINEHLFREDYFLVSFHCPFVTSPSTFSTGDIKRCWWDTIVGQGCGPCFGQKLPPRTQQSRVCENIN
jgi:hypothetical protein